MIRLGICAWILPGDPFQQMEAASGLGLEGIVIDFGPWTEDNPMRTQKYRARLMSKAESLGLKMPTLALNAFCQRGMTQPDNESYAKELLEEAVMAASEMGIEKLQVPSFYDNLVETDQDLDQTIKVLTYACVLGEDYGVKIGTENVFTIKEHQKMIEQIKSPALASLYDTQNPWRMKNQDGVKMAEYLAAMAAELHAKDSDPEAKGHVALGKGDVRFLESMTVFANAGYEGWVQLESRYDLDGDWRGQIEEDMAIIRKIFE